MSWRNNTDFDVKWLRQNEFLNNESGMFRYRELMDFNGSKVIKVLITIDLEIPSVSGIFFQYCDSHGHLEHCEYNGEIISKKKLILLLKAIYPDLAKKFNDKIEE